MASVQLRNISKAFGNVIAVDNINFQVNDGEFFSLLGPSGCGKTTILRMIAGFYLPTTGNILFNDKDISSLPPNKRNTGMVFQNYALFPHLSVFENVAFGLQARKVSKYEIRDRVMKALGLVNLINLDKRHVTQLSGGQQQRVALARAIVIEPEILLLDEPLSNLDAKLRRETREQIFNLQKKLKITTIYVTHDQEEALVLSDKILLLNEGKYQQLGTPYEIYNQPVNEFVAKFIGRSNLLNGIIKQIYDRIVLIEITNGLILSAIKTNDNLFIGQNVTLAIKPESIMLRNEKNTNSNVFIGKIIDKHFNGYWAEYQISINDIKINTMTLGEKYDIYEINDEVYIEIEKDKIIFYRQE